MRPVYPSFPYRPLLRFSTNTYRNIAPRPTRIIAIPVIADLQSACLELLYLGRASGIENSFQNDHEPGCILAPLIDPGPLLLKCCLMDHFSDSSAARISSLVGRCL